MQEEELINLITKIQRRRCEGQQVEVKKAFSGCPTSLYDTLSSFSNQDTGGTIVFGLDEDAFKEMLREISNNYPDFLKVSFVADLDNVILSTEKTSLDVVDLVSGGM